MKICFIAPANNYHTKKWAGWFASHGHEVHVISFVTGYIPDVNVHVILTGADPEGSDASKLKYLLHARKLKTIADEIKPDIVHVHYATSYGTAAALSGIRNYLLSVWGSDIYEFPRKSILHRIMLEFSLRRAALILSTSKAMAKETRRYTRKKIVITPFGVDMNLFSPQKRTRAPKDGKFIIGTVKTLSETYGISSILKAAAIVQKQLQIPLEIRIAGKGPQEEEYKALARQIGIDSITVWLGFISQEDAASEWANMDLALIPSALESFGVSAVEAQACGTPVIISAVPGLMESTKPGLTSVTVKPNSAECLAEAVIALYRDSEKRRRMSAAGRRFVKTRFELNRCFQRIERIYRSLKK